MTRRELLCSAVAAVVSSAAEPPLKLSVEGYIFQQYAQRKKKPLAEVIGEVLPMARAAGFTNLELNSTFFTPALREQVLAALRTQKLRMPSVYVGGAMHENELAAQTIAKALEIGAVCKPFGCRAIVNNPDPKRNNEEKTDAELAVEAESLNRMGRALDGDGFELRVHHHTPQLVNHAREWRYLLGHTDPQYVHICVDVDWAYEGGFDPLTFLREVGSRLRELHIRSAKNKLWLEDVEDSDIDYRGVAAYLKEQKLHPLVVVELAYRANTIVTRPLEDDLRLSRIYVEKVFT
ncbi:MAG TPA: TIM barrel protein [Bryobacteraceae bacterium]|jgi:inosose dehydratase